MLQVRVRIAGAGALLPGAVLAMALAAGSVTGASAEDFNGNDEINAATPPAGRTLETIRIATDPASNGTLTITDGVDVTVNGVPAPGQTFRNRLEIGQQGQATLDIVLGATVDATGGGACDPPNTCGAIFGNGAGSSAEVTISGGAQLLTQSFLTVGQSAIFTLAEDGFDFGQAGGATTADLSVLSGGLLRSENSIIALADSTSGDGTETVNATVLVSGAGSKWEARRIGIGADIAGDGSGASGELRVSDGGLVEVADGIAVGVQPNASATVGIDTGGVLTASGMFVGRDGGAGTATVDGAGSRLVVSTPADDGYLNVGGNAGSTGELTVRNGGKVEVSDHFGVGSFDGGDGTVVIEDGGIMEATGTPSGLVGRGAGATGVMTVTGASSRLVLTGEGIGEGADLQVGRNGGDGTINVLAGGVLEMKDPDLPAVSDKVVGLKFGRDGGTGALNVDSASVDISSAGGAQLWLGREDAGHGTATLTNGAQVSLHDTEAGANDSKGATVLIGRGNGTGQLSATGSGLAVTSDNSKAYVEVGRDAGSNGTMTLNAATVEVAAPNYRSRLRVGENAGSTGLLIANNGSSISVIGDEARFMVGEGGSGTANIAGSQVDIHGGANGALRVGDLAGAVGLLSLSDSAVSVMGDEARFVLGREPGAVGQATVSSGATVDVTGTSSGMVDIGHGDGVNGGTGTLTVTGAGTSVSASHAIRIGRDDEGGASSGILSVGGGASITAPEIVVGHGGILMGNGGTINGDVIDAGGIIAPGTSPGVMNINGNLEILDGLLEIEIAGTAPGEFDVLNVSGDLIAPGGIDLRLSFLDFLPGIDDVFQFLIVAGDSSDFMPESVNLSLEGLPDGYAFALAGTDGNFSVAVTDVAPVPLPAAFWLFAGGLGALALSARTPLRRATGAPRPA